MDLDDTFQALTKKKSLFFHEEKELGKAIDCITFLITDW